MKSKLWLKYFIYILLILAWISFEGYIEGRFRVDFNRNFRINVDFYALVILINVGMGLLLGAEHLINEIKKEGNWKINLPKIILIVLPSLYFSLTYYFLYNTNQFVQKILTYPFVALFKNGTTFISTFQLIVGYMLITSFYKQKT